MERALLRRLKSKASVLIKLPLVNAMRGVPLPTLTPEQAQRAIEAALQAGGHLIGRVGMTEAAALHFHLNRRSGRSDPAPYPVPIATAMKRHAGLFPPTAPVIDRYCAISLAAIDAIDVYAAWTAHDRVFAPQGVPRIRLYDLDPFFCARPWTRALEGRCVAVVSPFKVSILAQYARRDALFERPVLPHFDLRVVAAPQTHVGTDVSTQDWFDNLERLDREIAAHAPDMVLLGAGGYGLPLAARAKRRGSSAIVLGGITQLLFGIYGNRWLNDPAYRRLINPAWRRPSEAERPPGYATHEIAGGAYW